MFIYLNPALYTLHPCGYSMQIEPNHSNPSPRPSARIESVTIEGFRSLKSIQALPLSNLSVLIGGNGVGKSSFIRFFEMLSWMLRSQNLSEFVVRQGGGDDQFFMGARCTPRIHAHLKLTTSAGINEYRFDLVHISAGDKLMVMNEAYRYSSSAKPSEARWSELVESGLEAHLPLQNNATAKTICGLLRQCATYQFHDTSANALMHQRWDVSDCARLRSDGANLAAILWDLKEQDLPRYKGIVRQIQRVFPTLKDFILEPVAGKVLLRWRSQYGDKEFGTHLTSDGTLRLFCLITLLSLPAERLPDVIFFDEPELGLHPHAIALVAEMMKRVAATRQVFIATQSPYMVDCFELENIILAEEKGGATELQSMNSEHYRRWLADEYLISDLWLKHPVGTPL